MLDLGIKIDSDSIRVWKTMRAGSSVSPQIVSPTNVERISYSNVTLIIFGIIPTAMNNSGRGWHRRVFFVTVAWWVDCPLLLSMVCVGSIPSVIKFFLCEQLEVSLSQRLVRGAGRAPKITATKSARFHDLEILSPSNQQGPGTGASGKNASPPTAGLR